MGQPRHDLTRQGECRRGAGARRGITGSGRQGLEAEAAARAHAGAAALLVRGRQLVPRQLSLRDVAEAHQHALVLLRHTSARLTPQLRLCPISY